MQVRAICVKMAYHSKLGVLSLSGDSKNARHSPAEYVGLVIDYDITILTAWRLAGSHTHMRVCVCVYI